MSSQQQVARVNVSDEDWIEFRTVAVRQNRSIADYLGDLVHRELDRRRRRTSAPEPRPAEPAPAKTHSPRQRRTEVAGRELLTSLPRPAPKPPTWEE